MKLVIKNVYSLALWLNNSGLFQTSYTVIMRQLGVVAHHAPNFIPPKLELSKFVHPVGCARSITRSCIGADPSDSARLSPTTVTI